MQESYKCQDEDQPLTCETKQYHLAVCSAELKSMDPQFLQTAIG